MGTHAGVRTRDRFEGKPCVLSREVALGSHEKLGGLAAGLHLPEAGPHKAKAVHGRNPMCGRPQSAAQAGPGAPSGSPSPSK